MTIHEQAERIRQAQSESRKEQENAFRFTDIRDFLREPQKEISWIVDGMLPASGLSLVSAKPKVGKSCLVRTLAVSVSNGEPFLNRQTTQGKVFYLALEEKRDELREHFRLLGATNDIYVFTGTVPEKVHELVTVEIEKVKPALLIIDPLSHYSKIRDFNDYGQTTQALKPVISLSRETGTHVLLVHHSSKAGTGQDSVLGSTGLLASVDTAIFLRRFPDNTRTVETVQRYGTDLQETILRWNPDLRYSDLGGTRSEQESEQQETRILEYLKTCREPATENEIQDSVEGRRERKIKAIRNLLRNNRIQRIGTGGKREPFRYFFHVPDSPEHEQKTDSCSQGRVHEKHEQNQKDNAILAVHVPMFPISVGYTGTRKTGKLPETENGFMYPCSGVREDVPDFDVEGVIL